MRFRFLDLYEMNISKELLERVEYNFCKKKEARVHTRTIFVMIPLRINCLLSKQDRAKLQQVKILIEVFEEPNNPKSNTGLSFIHSCLSEVVTNSKSKECGPFRLFDLAPGTKSSRMSFLWLPFLFVALQT